VVSDGVGSGTLAILMELLRLGCSFEASVTRPLERDGSVRLIAPTTGGNADGFTLAKTWMIADATGFF